MKRCLLTISFLLSFAVASFAQRVTTIITSINSNTSEAVTISTAWTGTDGDLILSSSVPASVKVGDTITDNGSNTYLITGISGSTLTSQDFDSATDPVTGSATIQEAYATFTDWETDLDDTILYASGDDALGEPYDNGAFASASITINSTAASLNSIKLIPPVAERHDGTAGTGVRLDMSTAAVGILVDNVNQVTINFLEVFASTQNGNRSGIRIVDSDSVFVTQCIVHDWEVTSQDFRSLSGLTSDPQSLDENFFLNNFVYDIKQNSATDGTGVARGITESGAGQANFQNNTVFNVSHANATDSQGIDEGFDVQNNIAMDCENDFTGTPAGTESHNLSSDGTAAGTGSLIDKTTANQFVSTTGGFEDLHIQDTAADGFEAGIDLATDPTGLNFDIDNFDRDAGATTWSMGAHDGDNLRGVAVITGTRQGVRPRWWR